MKAMHEELVRMQVHEPAVLQGYRDPDDPAVIVFVLDRTIEFPPAYGLAVGEIVHQLRSTLDNLAWQLALLKRNDPSPHTLFTLVSDPGQWAHAKTRRLADLLPEHRAFVKRYQPFVVDPVHPDRHVLARLHALSVQDKHQILIAIPIAAIGSVVESLSPGVFSIESVPAQVVMTKGAEMYRGRLVGSPLTEKQVQMKGSLGFLPALPDGEAVEPFLRSCWAYVHDVVQDARQFF